MSLNAAEEIHECISCHLSIPTSGADANKKSPWMFVVPEKFPRRLYLSISS